MLQIQRFWPDFGLIRGTIHIVEAQTAISAIQPIQLFHSVKLSSSNDPNGPIGCIIDYESERHRSKLEEIVNRLSLVTGTDDRLSRDELMRRREQITLKTK